MHAVHHKQHKVAKLLAENGANVTLRAKNGSSAFDIANLIGRKREREEEGGRKREREGERERGEEGREREGERGREGGSQGLL